MPFLAALPLLASTVLAADLESETVTQIRHDWLGNTSVPIWQYVRLNENAGSSSFRGYVGLGWLSGPGGTMDASIYDLNASAEALGGQFTIGRQQGLDAIRMESFDGLRMDRSLSRHLDLAVWSGITRHQDLDDLVDGRFIGRSELGLHFESFQGRVGAEYGGLLDTESILRQDAQGRLLLGQVQMDGRFVLAESLGEPDTPPVPVPEWAELAATGRFAGVLDAGVDVRHRETADPEDILGDSLLQVLAGTVDEVGLSMRIHGARRAEAAMRYAVLRYGVEALIGHQVDLSWQPAFTGRPWRLVPSITSRVSPDGQYHAFSLAGTWQVTDATTTTARAVAASYVQGDAVWDAVAAGQLDLSTRPVSWAAAGIMASTVRSGEGPLDSRAGISVTFYL